MVPWTRGPGNGRRERCVGTCLALETAAMKERPARIPLIATAVTLALLLAACGSPASPPQSPTNDAQPPAPSTGDGKMIGADGVPPAQKLEEGPKLDSKDGVKPAATPPHD